MKLISLVILFIYSCTSSTPNFQDKMNKISKNGMTVSWETKGDRLVIKMFAPTKGWLAIGFNDKGGLANTNLIMSCVRNGQVFIEDQFIKSPGSHIKVTDLGGNDQTSRHSGEETAKGTTISFEITQTALDQFHHNLKEGQKYHLLMAFSREDDFQHHSMMRTSIEIIL